MRHLVKIAPIAVLSSLAGSVLAVPAIMDRIPANAAVAIAIPSAERMEKDIRSVATMFGAPAGAINLDMALEQIGLAGAVTKSGPIAFFFVMPEKGNEMEEPTTGIIFTAPDFDGVVKAVSGKVTDGIATAEMNGQAYHFKKLDGNFIFASTSSGYVKGFEGKGGSSAALKAMIGSAADKATDKSDVSIVLNIETLRPFIEMGLDQMMSAVEQSPMPEAQLEQFQSFMELFSSTMLKDTKAVTATMNIEPVGISLDLFGRFAEKSALNELANSKTDASAFLGKVPSVPYLAAFSADMRSPALKKIMASVPEPKAPAAKPAAAGAAEKDDMKGGAKPDAKTVAAPPTPKVDLKAMKELFELTDGSATVVGVSPAGILGGILTRSVSYTATKDPAKYSQLQRQAMAKLRDDDAADYTFVADGAEVGGKKVDVYELKLKPDADNPMAAQMLAGLYGLSGGPNGYMTTAGGGLVTTFAKSSELMASGIKSAEGGGGLTDDKTLAATMKNLPSGRMAEAYIGVKGILDSVGGLLATAKPNLKLDLPETLPPLAAAITPGDGTIQATIFAPTPTLKTLGDLAKQFRQTDEEDAPAKDGGKDGGKKDGGKPKF